MIYKSYGYAMEEGIPLPNLEEDDDKESSYVDRKMCFGLTAEDVNQPQGKVFRSEEDVYRRACEHRIATASVKEDKSPIVFTRPKGESIKLIDGDMADL